MSKRAHLVAVPSPSGARPEPRTDASLVDAIRHHHARSLETVPEGEARQLLALLKLTEKIAAAGSTRSSRFFHTAADVRLLEEMAEALGCDESKLSHVILEFSPSGSGRGDASGL